MRSCANWRSCFFSGLTTEEIALASGVSRATVVRNGRFAKAWRLEQLAPLGKKD